MKQGQGRRHSKDKSMKGENADCVEQRYNYLKQKWPWSPAVQRATMRKKSKLSQLPPLSITLIHLRGGKTKEKEIEWMWMPLGRRSCDLSDSTAEPVWKKSFTFPPLYHVSLKLHYIELTCSAKCRKSKRNSHPDFVFIQSSKRHIFFLHRDHRKAVRMNDWELWWLTETFCL